MEKSVIYFSVSPRLVLYNFSFSQYYIVFTLHYLLLLIVLFYGTLY